MPTTRRAALLELLSDRQWHSPDEMIRAAGHRFAAPLFELRREGYVIETDHVVDERYRYRLVATPGEQVRTIAIHADGQAVLSLEG